MFSGGGVAHDTRDTANRFRNFHARRVLRIFPLYYGVLLAGWMLTPIFHWIWHPAWYLWPLYPCNYVRFIWMGDFIRTGRLVRDLWSWLGPVENLSSSLPFRTPVILMFQHFWSLCVEEQFYLVWPLVVFLIGCCGDLADAIPRADSGNRVPILVTMSIGFAVFEIGYRVHAGHAFVAELNSLGMSTFGFTFVDLFAAAVLLVALDSSSWMYRFLTWKPLRRLGQISYGFYVYHQIPEALYFTLMRMFTGTSAC